MINQKYNNIFTPSITNEIQDNLVEFFDWYLLERGNYFNATLGETSPYSADYSQLSLSSSSSFDAGQAWEGHRKNWVWQSGISPSGITPPIVGTDSSRPGVSGVYVDDVFYPSNTTGAYAHHVDYFNGRVVFDSPISTTSKVQVEHSYKYINVIYASSLPWFREIRKNSLRKTLNEQIKTPPEMQAQLPLIAVEVGPRRTFKPYMMGGVHNWMYTDILFHCIAEDDITRNKLVDFVSLRSDHKIDMFSTSGILADNVFPIDYRGSPNPNAMTFPEMVTNYPLGQVRIENASLNSIDILNTDLFGSVVTLSTEVILKH